MARRNFLILVAVLSVSAVISISLYVPARQSGDTVSVSAFPARIGQWTGVDIQLEPRVYELLETRNLIMRDYSDGAGNAVNLYIVYSQSNRKVAHPPEICMQGGGAVILKKDSTRITSGIVANRLVLATGKSRQMVWYWYRAGTRYTSSYLSQQLFVSWERLFRRNISTAMIRIFVPVGPAGEEAAKQTLLGFVQSIEPFLDVYLP